jgi:hypothetical protein
MFAVNSAVCDNLRAKNKWYKEICLICGVSVSKCKKLNHEDHISDKDVHPAHPDDR